MRWPIGNAGNRNLRGKLSAPVRCGRFVEEDIINLRNAERVRIAEREMRDLDAWPHDSPSERKR